MISLKVSKGFCPNIAGKPADTIVDSDKQSLLGVSPSQIPFIKPKIHVNVGDHVDIGSLLFTDKKNPDIKFLSPGCGTVSEINFGKRHAAESIIISLNKEETHLQFEPIPEIALEKISRDKLIRHMLEIGVWNFLRQFPFRDIANPNQVPSLIIVTLGNKEPFTPEHSQYMQGHKADFLYGVELLKRLVDKRDNVIVSAFKDSVADLSDIAHVITHSVVGTYPANDPGVILYHVRKSGLENNSWFIDAQDVISLGKTMRDGQYFSRRIVTVGGVVDKTCHINARLGTQLRYLIPANKPVAGSIRWILGGVFTGSTTTDKNFIGLYDKAVNLVDLGETKELFGFVRPGYAKPSYSRAFFSFFNKSRLNVDCNIHGGIRACINCGNCANVCPVDILPQFMYKGILAEEAEEYLAFGLLDCVECGLCSYVCPSKIELCNSFKLARQKVWSTK